MQVAESAPVIRGGRENDLRSGPRRTNETALLRSRDNNRNSFLYNDLKTSWAYNFFRAQLEKKGRSTIMSDHNHHFLQQLGTDKNATELNLSRYSTTKDYEIFMHANISTYRSAGSLTTSVPADVLIVDQEAAKELQCGICLQLVRVPRQCKNGHLFCMECIAQSLERKSYECPVCRCVLRLEVSYC